MKQINKRAAFYAVCGIVMAGSFCQYLYDALDDATQSFYEISPNFTNDTL